MNRSTTQIIEDLNRLDPDFKVDDPALQKVVADFIENQPYTHFDEAFSARLRSELIKPHYYKSEPVSFISPYLSLFNNRIFTGVVGACMALLVVVPLTYVVTKNTIEQDTTVALKDISTGLTLKQQINDKTSNAFGKLAYIQPQPTQDSSLKTMSVTSTAATVAGSPTPTSMSAPAPVVVYVGEELKLSETEGKVYRRVKGIDAGKELANFLKNAKFDVVNVEAFSKLSLETIQLSEDTPLGQTVSVNFNEGTIAITPYTDQWNTSSETSKSPEKLTPEQLIEIANVYIKEHGIDVQEYGKPVVSSETGVTYPLLIDGLEVYEEAGTVYGLEVMIDLKEKKVSSVNNLTSQLYEGSLYALETNPAKIIKAVSGGAKNKIELSTPRRVLIRYVVGDSSNELYVPGLLFVTKEKNILVPLVKDALEKISVASFVEKATTTPPIVPLKNRVE